MEQKKAAPPLVAESWQPALERYGAVTGLTVALYGIEGKPVGEPVPPTPLFAALARQAFKPGAFSDCARHCLGQVTERPAVVIAPAYGLGVVGCSLVLGGIVTGAAVAGYALVEFPSAQGIERLARAAGLPFRELWNIARQQQPVPERRLALHGELLQVLGDTLLREGDRLRQRDEIAAQLREEMAAKDSEATQRRKAEAALLRAQKMEAVGRLAGGIAHDFNNLLTVILGHAEFLGEQVRGMPNLQREVESIQASAQRAAELTHHLLAFGRKQLMKRRVIDLADAVRGAVGMLRRLIGADVQLVLDISAEPLRVKADPTQLDQVLMNIAVNARDAMPTGGQIRIRTSTVDLDTTAGGAKFDAVPGSYALLEITDSGHGMAAAVREHAFDPFFTTKELGKGTGLGLSMVYGIVKQHGGYVLLDSEVEKGTICRIYLPLTNAAPEQLAPQTAAAPIVAAPAATVLVAEDQAEVRSLICRILLAQGYGVLEAGDGPSALAISRNHAGTIDLLLTDLVMPAMGGQELARRLREERPGIAILFISGYSDKQLPDLEQQWATLLHKPFRSDELAAVVQQVLLQKRGEGVA